MEGNTVKTTLTDSLRAMADLLDQHSCLASEWTYDGNDVWQFFHGPNTPEMVAQAAYALGTCEKVPDGNDYQLVKDFGNGLKLRLCFYSPGVCKRIVKGTKTVEREVYALDAPKTIVREEVEEFEWVCPDSLGQFLPSQEEYQETAVRA